MSLLLEQLEQFGNIVIMDKEDNCYAIFTKNPYQVAKLLIKNEIKFESEPIYSKEEGKKQEYCIDFQL